MAGYKLSHQQKKNAHQTNSAEKVPQDEKQPEQMSQNQKRVSLTCNASYPVISPSLQNILNLHQTIGNQAVGRFIQAKLKIGRPGDKYEQEADRVANQVMNGPEPHLQRQIEPEEEESVQPKITDVTQVQRQEEDPEEEEEEPIQTKFLSPENFGYLQPKLETNADAKVQRQEEMGANQTKVKASHNLHLVKTKANKIESRAGSDKDTVGLAQRNSRSFQNRLQQSTGIGQTLPANTRSFMESYFGTDFGHVIIHTDSQASQMAHSVAARAFTHGRDIYFRAGHYNPETVSGRRLLTHELTHVIQQSGKPALKVSQKKFSSDTRKSQNQMAQPKILSRADRLIQRSRAVFISSHGRRRYLRYADRFHRAHGYTAPKRVGSVEEMMEHMARMPRPIEWVRIVSHALAAGIYLPLLRGGGTSLYKRDLSFWRTFEMEQELGLEHPTLRRRRRVGRRRRRVYVVETLHHHLTPAEWVGEVWDHLAGSTYENAMLLSDIGLGQRPNPMTDMHSFFWWILDRELISARETRRVHGRRRRRRRRRRRKRIYIFRMRRRARARLLASINRNVAIFRRKVIAGPYAGGIYSDVARIAPPEGAGRRTPKQIDRLETAIVEAARPLVQRARRERMRIAYRLPTRRYRSFQGALERGTYARNLLKVKYSIADGAEIQIRGCNIGKNRSWLESFRDFFSHGIGSRRNRPHVSAPRLRHFYGRRSRRSPWVEWLLDTRRRRRRGRRRSRRIYASDPRFDANIEHVR